MLPAAFGEALDYALLARVSIAVQAPFLTVQTGFVGLTGSANSSNLVDANDTVLSVSAANGIHINDESATLAQANLTAVMLDVGSRDLPPPFPVVTSASSTTTFFHGIYKNTESVTLGGDIIFDAEFNPFFMFIFQFGDSLVILPGTTVSVESSAQVSNIYYKVDGTVTIGDNCIVKGIIMASGDVTVGQNVRILGQILTKGQIIFAGGDSLVAIEIPVTAPPTFRPTASPTGQPTGQPSQQPSLSFDTEWLVRIPSLVSTYSTATVLEPVDPDSGSSSVNASSVETAHYTELYVRESIIDPYGGPAQFNTLISSDMAFLFAINKNASVIQLASVEDFLPDSPVLTRQCEGASAYVLSQGLRSGISATAISQGITMPCTDTNTGSVDMWQVRNCMNSNGDIFPALCVNCNDPCSASECNDPFVLSPGLTASTSGANGTCSRRASTNRGMFRALTVGFSDPVPAPDILGVEFNATRTSLSITVSLSADGAVYCGLVRPVPIAIQPTSTEEIRLKNLFGDSDNATLTLVATDLEPSTAYNVYCFTVSTQAVVMSTDVMVVAASLDVSTLCCKTVQIDISSATATESTNNPGTITVSLDSAPTSDLVVSLTTSFTSTDGTVSSRSTALFPSTLSFTNVVSSAFSVGYVAPSDTGVDAIIVVLSGSSAAEYSPTVIFENSISDVTVIGALVALPPPSLTSVRFSADGSALSVKFTGASDRANFAGSTFTCSNLLSFPGISTSSCRWTDKTTLRVSLGAFGAATIAVGNNLTVLGGMLRASCGDNTATFCATWNTTAAATSTVLVPLTPVSPTVSASVPSVLGACTPLTIDLSGSTGSGGRAFSHSFTVQHSAGNSSFINSFLASKYSLSPPTPIPAAMFQPGTSYIFTAKLTNFLGGVGQTTFQIVVFSTVVPVASIRGSSLRTHVTGNALALSASASVDASCNGKLTTKNLTYAWSISTAVDGLLPLVSTSTDRTAFQLPVYSLTPDTLYTVSVRVTYTVSGLSATSTAKVMVEQSDIVAVIGGASDVTLKALTTLQLDGSTSYDEDINPSTGANTGLTAGLSYAWACSQLSPTLSNDCPLDVESANATGEVFALRQLDTSLVGGTVIEVTLTVTSGARSSSSSVTITTVPAAAPSVTISPVTTSSGLSTISYTSFNVGKQFRLNAFVVVETVVDAVAAESATVQCNWVVDGDQIDSSSALTPVARTVVPTVSATGLIATTTTNVNLLLRKSMLPTGSDLVFRLDCGAGFNAFAVTTNGPPSSGSFAVTPALGGVEVSTVFTFAASNWIDVNLPLTYEFAFLTVAGVSQVIQARAETSFASPLTGLPSGLDSNNYTLTCLASVFDSLLSSVTVSASVEVLPAADATSSLEDALSGLDLSDSSSVSVDESTSILATSSAVLNSVSCGGAPNCTVLNREACSSTANTCGSCISPFLGVEGASNTSCVDPTLTSNSYVVGSVCFSDTDCPLFMECSDVEFVCIDQPLECLRSSQCSGNGDCSYIDTDTDLSVDSCLIGASDCTVKCTCDTGFYGADCSVDQAAYDSRVLVRTQLIVGLQQLVNTQNPSADVVSSWVGTLQSIVAGDGSGNAASELSTASRSILISVAQKILSVASSSGISPEEISGVLVSLNALLAAGKNNNDDRRRLATTSSAEQLALVLQYTKSVMDSMIVGQDPVVEILSLYRYSVISADTAGGLVQLQTPLSELETANGAAGGDSAGVVSIMLNESYGPSAFASIHQFKASLFPGAINETTNPVTVSLDDVQRCGVGGDCTMVFSLPTLESEEYIYDVELETYEDLCFADGVVTSHEHSCVFGNPLLSNCSGNTEHLLVSTCDGINFREPTCERIVGGVLLSPADDSEVQCELLDASENRTICSCLVSAEALTTALSGSARRRLADDPVPGSISFAGSSKTYDIDATVVEVPYSPSSAPTSAPTEKVIYEWYEILYIGLEQNDIVVGLSGGALFILLCAYFWRWRQISQKLKDDNTALKMASSWQLEEDDEFRMDPDDDDVDGDDGAMEADFSTQNLHGKLDGELIPPEVELGFEDSEAPGSPTGGQQVQRLNERMKKLRLLNSRMRLAAGWPAVNPNHAAAGLGASNTMVHTSHAQWLKNNRAHERELRAEVQHLEGVLREMHPGKTIKEVCLEAEAIAKHRKMIPREPFDSDSGDSDDGFGAHYSQSNSYNSNFSYSNASLAARKKSGGLGSPGKQPRIQVNNSGVATGQQAIVRGNRPKSPGALHAHIGSDRGMGLYNHAVPMAEPKAVGVEKDEAPRRKAKKNRPTKTTVIPLCDKQDENENEDWNLSDDEGHDVMNLGDIYGGGEAKGADDEYTYHDHRSVSRGVDKGPAGTKSSIIGGAAPSPLPGSVYGGFYSPPSTSFKSTRETAAVGGSTRGAEGFPQPAVGNVVDKDAFSGARGMKLNKRREAVEDPPEPVIAAESEYVFLPSETEQGPIIDTDAPVVEVALRELSPDLTDEHGLLAPKQQRLSETERLRLSAAVGGAPNSASESVVQPPAHVDVPSLASLADASETLSMLAGEDVEERVSPHLVVVSAPAAIPTPTNSAAAGLSPVKINPRMVLPSLAISPSGKETMSPAGKSKLKSTVGRVIAADRFRQRLDEHRRELNNAAPADSPLTTGSNYSSSTAGVLAPSGRTSSVPTIDSSATLARHKAPTAARVLVRQSTEENMSARPVQAQDATSVQNTPFASPRFARKPSSLTTSGGMASSSAAAMSQSPIKPKRAPPPRPPPVGVASDASSANSSTK